MEFRILGSLDVRDGDRGIPLAAGKQRALLALLLLNANETISTERLVDELWGELAPATAPKAVQNHVSHLRRVLEDNILVTRGSGYTLLVEPGSLDLDRFEQLLEEGRRALAGGNADSAADLLREALTLWRGPPLADFTFEPFAQTEIARLEERHLVGLEERIEADLTLGRHTDLVGELEALVDRHPLRERFRGQLMLALYRSQRQAEALAAYQAARKALVEELGIEPSAELQQLERLILQQDSALDLAPRAREREAGEDERGAGALIGRERELAMLLTGLSNAVAGRGSLFLVSGDPGIGKSRLADEVVEQARERGAVALIGRAWEAGGAPAYWPWVQAIRSYLRNRDPATIREQLGSGAADVAQMIPELREQLPEIGSLPPLDPEGARFRLFDATTSFLRSAAEVQPLVLVLDDLHAADIPSLVLLEFLAQELAGARILVLGLYRDVDLASEHPLSSTLVELVRSSASSLRLTGLPEDEVAHFIEAVHGVEAPGELASEVHRQTEGNPFFVGETLRLLAAEGRLDETAESPTPVGIPTSVRDLIGRRLRHLSGNCKVVLTLASVLGREFDVDALRRVSEHELDSLLDLLDEAISAGVIGDAPGGRARLRFTHVLIRDALYDELTATGRMRLHRSVGEALEALYASNPGNHLAELAYHFYEAVPAAEAEKAVRYARAAGDDAAIRLAYEESARLYAIAIELVESEAASDDVERCELLLRLGDVQGRSGDIPAAKETLLLAARTARGAGLREQLARAALGYGGRFVWGRGLGDTKLLPLLEEALAALPEEDNELRVRLLARLAGGPLRETLALAPRLAMSQEAVDMARRLGDPATLAYALNGRLCANWGPDGLAERLGIADELIQVSEQVGDLERTYEGRGFRYYALLEGGDMLRAYTEHEALTRLAEELRQPAQLWDLAVNRASLALFEGRFAQAEVTIREALALGGLAQSAYAQADFDLQMYALRREQGRLEDVLEVVEGAVDLYFAYPVWRYVLVDVYSELGRTDEARAAFEILAGEGFPVHLELQWLFSLSLLPDVCRGLGDVDRAATLYELLRPYADRNSLLAQEICRGSVSRGLGILAAMLARWNEAVEHFENALRRNSEMGALPSLAYTRYDYGCALLDRGEPGDGDRGRELLASAKALSEKLEMDSLSVRISVLAGA